MPRHTGHERSQQRRQADTEQPRREVVGDERGQRHVVVGRAIICRRQREIGDEIRQRHRNQARDNDDDGHEHFGNGSNDGRPLRFV